MVSRKFMFIAGEASGDTLAAELVQALRNTPAARQQPGPPEFFGAGGNQMQAAGAEVVVDLVAHAVVGLWEVLRNYGTFKRFFDQLLALAIERQPDVIILVDYPGFNLRFAAAVKERVRRQQGVFNNWSPKVVFFVSPQLWAWHASRVYQIARDIDLMLTIFPFEKAWYAKRVPQLPVEFVGHPLIDRHAARAGASPGMVEPATAPPLVLLLPGSRRRELSKHLPVMLPAAAQLAAQGRYRFRMSLPDEALAAMARDHAGGLPGLEICVGGLAKSLAEATVALASSGTVTMECAFFGVPTVVLYRTSRATYWLGRHFIQVRHIAMPNLLANETIYPEFVQHQAVPDNLAREALDLLTNETRRRRVTARLAAVMESLGGGGACARAADAIQQLVSPSRRRHWLSR